MDDGLGCPSMLTNSLYFFWNLYSDAPALSTDNDGAFSGTGASTLSGLADPASPDINDAGEQWDDEALAATLTKKVSVPVATASSTAELLDMKALDLKRNEKGDIAEKLRVEETKAQLAAAREGMEREAQRIKEEKEKKEQGGAESSKPRFGTAAAGMTGAGGGMGTKWVPPHMRGGGTGLLPTRLVGGGVGGKLDTQDENLFPDLAAAAAITEQQKNQQPAFKIPKKTPVGGGATWGAKMKKANEARKEENAAQEVEPATPASPSAPEVEPPKEEDEASVVEQEAPAAETAAPESSDQETAEGSTAAAAKAAVKPKKKKKKDLSTFKPSD
jgi:hypothetical protein